MTSRNRISTQQKSFAEKDDPLVSALTGETVTYASSLGKVTRNCVVVRDSIRGAHVIVSIDRLNGLKKSCTSVPALLVVAAGLFTITAAAVASRQGVETSAPIGALGIMFLLAFLGTRRAAVVFLMDGETVESTMGSHRDATLLIAAVEKMRVTSKLSKIDT